IVLRKLHTQRLPYITRAQTISIPAYAAPTRLCTLSLHDALPIYEVVEGVAGARNGVDLVAQQQVAPLGERFDEAERGYLLLRDQDRKSTRLNSSHAKTSYAVFRVETKKK